MIRAALAILVAAIGAMTVAGLWLLAATPRTALPVGFRLEEFAVYSLIQLSFGSVGLLLADRRSRNPIGWLFLATALVSAWLTFSSAYALSAMSEGRAEGLAVAWLYNWSPTALFPLVVSAIVLFPDGRPATPSGRVALWLLPSSALIAIFVASRQGPMFNMPSVQNPYSLAQDDPLSLIVLLAGAPSFGIVMVLFVRDLMERFRTASGVRRQQLKWLLWSGLLVVATTGLSGSLAFVSVGGPSGDALTYLGRATFTLAISTLPVALGVAVLRHRLYDIDLLIKRTLVYGALSTVLVAVYAAFVVLLGTLLRPFTGGSDVAVAGSTLAVVALVQPVRRRIQDVVDRRFYRSRYDAARTLDAFNTRLRDDVDLDSVRSEMLAVVGETVQPAHAGVWLAAAFGGSVTLSGRAITRKDSG